MIQIEEVCAVEAAITPRGYIAVGVGNTRATA
jgi:hypothetical protein